MSAELALVHTGQSTVNEMIRRRDMLYDFTKHVMVDGLDYGAIPGTDKKTLLKPGAEKLCTLFNFVPHFEIVNQIEDWQGDRTGGEPLFYYLYRASLYRNGELVAQGDGSANSRENKYRFRWVSEEQAKFIPGYENFAKRGGRTSKFEPDFAINKAETGGKYGKPAEYWQAFRDAIQNGTAKAERKKMGQKEYDGYSITIDETQYRVPNPDVFDLINTLQKMAQKRALTAVVLIAANASELYTQDMETDDVPTTALVTHSPPPDLPPFDPDTGEIHEPRSAKNADIELQRAAAAEQSEREAAEAKRIAKEEQKAADRAAFAKFAETADKCGFAYSDRESLILLARAVCKKDRPTADDLNNACTAKRTADWNVAIDTVHEQLKHDAPAAAPPADALDIPRTAEEIAEKASKIHEETLAR